MALYGAFGVQHDEILKQGVKWSQYKIDIVLLSHGMGLHLTHVIHEVRGSGEIGWDRVMRLGFLATHESKN